MPKGSAKTASDRPLNARERRFVEVFAGNATDAARLAGYKGGENTLAQTGRRLLRKAQIVEAIRAREKKELRPKIASRQERQRFWTRIMRSKAHEPKDRLKASELLGKSEADFTENIRADVKTSHEDALGELE